jgi:putative ABC transport system permease protein
VVLLGIAASVGTSMLRLASADSGFDAENVLTVQLAPPARFPQPSQRAAFVQRVLDAVSGLPGVVAAGSTQTTFDPNASMQTRVDIEGQPVVSGQMPVAHIRHITPGYFVALGVAIDDGRPIDQRDQIGTLPVASVSRAFAARYWPGTSAIGKRFRRISAADRPWLTVVGVVEDVMDSGLGAPMGPTIYVPYLQQNTPTARVSLAVRTTGDPEAIGAAVQKAIWSVDPAQPIDRLRTLQRALDESIAQPRFRTLLLAIFGSIGLMLAGVGVYGIAVESATQRRKEIGVRLALGSTRFEVVSLLVRQAAMPVVVGGCLGVVAAGGAQTLIRSTLYQPPRFDWVVAPVIAAVVLSSVALLATWLPAWRASRLEPIKAIRE